MPGLMPPPAIQMVKAPGIVVAADKLHHLAAAIFPHGGAAEFPAPHHQRVLQHAALLEVSEQRRNGLIGFAAAVGQADDSANLSLTFRGRPIPSGRAE